MILPLLVTALAASSAAAPTLSPISITEAQGALRIEPGYHATHGGSARATVVGAYEIVLPVGRRITAAYSPGYLPLEIRTDDGSCSYLMADYVGGEIKNAASEPIACGRISPEEKPQAAPAPNLRLIDTTWSYGVWADDGRGETVVTAPKSDHAVMLRLALPVVAVRAITSPDAPLSTLSVVGTLGGRTVWLVVDVAF